MESGKFVNQGEVQHREDGITSDVINTHFRESEKQRELGGWEGGREGY